MMIVCSFETPLLMPG